MSRTLTLLLLIAFAAQAEDDEVRFKPKSYAPGKTLQSRAYAAPAYTPSENPRPTGSPAKASRAGFWRRLTQPKYVGGTPLADEPSEKGAAFRPEQHISASTLSANPGAAAEHIPFEDAGKKLADAGYTAPEKPREKNPLLKPRQGIKEPQ